MKCLSENPELPGTTDNFYFWVLYLVSNTFGGFGGCNNLLLIHLFLKHSRVQFIKEKKRKFIIFQSFLKKKFCNEN